jgi:hypothetical protein
MLVIAIGDELQRQRHRRRQNELRHAADGGERDQAVIRANVAEEAAKRRARVSAHRR